MLKSVRVTAGTVLPCLTVTSAMLMMSAKKSGELGLSRLPKYRMGCAGCDRSDHGYGPVPATKKLKRAGLTIDDIALSS